MYGQRALEDDVTWTVGSRPIADGRIQSAGLRSADGAHEMVFALYQSVSTGWDGLPRGHTAAAVMEGGRDAR